MTIEKSFSKSALSKLTKQTILQNKCCSFETNFDTGNKSVYYCNTVNTNFKTWHMFIYEQN